MNPKHLLAMSATLLVGPAVVHAQTTEDPQDLENRIADLEERFDQVEKKTVLDRISFGAEYRTNLNAVKYTGPTPDAYDPDPNNPAVGRQIQQTNSEIWSHRVRMSMKGEPIDSVKFTARMVMYKLFGDFDSAPFIQDSATTRLPRDSGARFERAWLDWFIFDWMALSVGRIAYSEGNPGELKENSEVRRATWGLHMVDGEYDTINLTFNVSDVWYTRLFYASWFNDNDQDPFGGFPFLNSGTDNLRIIGGNMDVLIPGIGKNLLQVGYYVVPRFRPFFLPIPDPAYDPAADPTHAPAPLNGASLFPSILPDSMGGYQNLSALFEMYNVGESGLDLFISGALGFLSPNGQGIAYDLPSNPADPTSPRQALPFLFLSSEGDSGTTVFFYGGLRYTVPSETLNFPKLGFEFNYGSRYLISFAVQTDNLLNKLATRGKAVETYAILPMNDYLFLRAAYLFIDADYSGGFFGPNPAIFGSTSPAIDQTIHSFSFTLNASM